MGLPVTHVQLDGDRKESEKSSRSCGHRQVPDRERKRGEGHPVECEEDGIGKGFEDDPLVDRACIGPGEKRQENAGDRCRNDESTSAAVGPRGIGWSYRVFQGVFPS
jgi:hypothetical protein